MMTKYIKWIVLIGFIVGGYFWFSQEKPIMVTVIQASYGDVESIVANTRAGTVSSCQRAKMSFPIGGTIASIDVKEGELVSQGQILMSLWNADRQSRIYEAKALVISRRQTKNSVCINAKNDTKILARTKKLVTDKLTSQENLDNALAKSEASNASCAAANAQIHVAQAVLNTTQASFEQTKLFAPFDGIVAEITGEIGEYSTPSPPGIPMPPAIDLLTHQCHYITAPIDEVDAADIQVGDPVIIRLDAFREQTFIGTVKRVAPYVQDFAKQARTVDVDVTFNKQVLPRLLTGYSADIEIVLEKHENVLQIPTDVIVDNQFVFIINQDSRIEKRALKLGLSNWQQTEVISGLSDQDKLVSTSGNSAIKPEVLVRVSVNNDSVNND
ncbi:efflux RND transporter periplasmic adaptor subunit [Colwellia sp. 12G3]|uniref:efflux RND transporter periplasmic adaptor subunit n=1 Tax=Colwellia sp. 12G3 TaxID=2058299 RepID=UPI000C323A94|nr:efflux RND transporter periplasmic adaptor subunit [Colwellia sp. 12G3]PKI17667.1 efflux RND transporter periplasmic adaptor subunit [Colwellia sp. 12G3]